MNGLSWGSYLGEVAIFVEMNVLFEIGPEGEILHDSHVDCDLIFVEWFWNGVLLIEFRGLPIVGFEYGDDEIEEELFSDEVDYNVEDE